MPQRHFTHRFDAVFIICLLVAALAAWLLYSRFNSSDNAPHAEIVVDNQVLTRISLTENQIIYIPGKPEVWLECRDGLCGFAHSDCPDQICVNSGFLGKTGQSAACLPNRVVLRIVSDAVQQDTPDTTVF